MSGKNAFRKLTPIPSALLISLLVNGLLVALIYKLQPAWVSHFEAAQLLGEEVNRMLGPAVAARLDCSDER